MPANVRLAKSKRINLKASADQENLLRRAAERKGQTVAEFIIETACEAAKREFTAPSQILLSSEKWKTFAEAIDRPARVHARLHELFATQSIIESSARGEENRASKKNNRPQH